MSILGKFRVVSTHCLGRHDVAAVRTARSRHTGED